MVKIRLTERDKLERRKTIINAAFQLFCDSGIEAVPLSKIAQKAKVSENTLYRYFGSKETLVMEAFIKLWDTIMQYVDQLAESIPNYGDLTGYGQMQVWIESFRHLYQFDKDFVLFSYEAKLYMVRHNIKLDKFQQDMLMQSFRGPCLKALEKGKMDGSIPVKEDSEDMFYAIWGAIRGYVVKIVIYENLYGEDSPWENRYNVLAKGILKSLSCGWDPP